MNPTSQKGIATELGTSKKQVISSYFRHRIATVRPIFRTASRTRCLSDRSSGVAYLAITKTKKFTSHGPHRCSVIILMKSHRFQNFQNAGPSLAKMLQGPTCALHGCNHQPGTGNEDKHLRDHLGVLSTTIEDKVDLQIQRSFCYSKPLSIAVELRAAEAKSMAIDSHQFKHELSICHELLRDTKIHCNESIYRTSCVKIKLSKQKTWHSTHPYTVVPGCLAPWMLSTRHCFASASCSIPQAAQSLAGAHLHIEPASFQNRFTERHKVELIDTI